MPLGSVETCRPEAAMGGKKAGANIDREQVTESDWAGDVKQILRIAESDTGSAGRIDIGERRQGSTTGISGLLVSITWITCATLRRSLRRINGCPSGLSRGR